MEKAVKLKDGRIATVIKEWNWKDHTDLKIYKDNFNTERLHEDFLDIELNGEFKTHRNNFAKPADSNYHHVYMTVCKKDVEFIKL